MKRIVFSIFVCLLLATNASAKKANAIWYFLAPMSSSISEDDNVSVQYSIYTKMAVPEHAIGPYPTMRITVTNKSDKVVFVDLGTSLMKLNEVTSAIYTPNNTSTRIVQNVDGDGGKTAASLSQRVVSIPPKSSMFLEDIQIFTDENVGVVKEFIYLKNIGTPAHLWCLSYRFNELEPGGIIDFSEVKTPFTIGFILNYSFTDGFNESNHIETKYYTKRVVGTSFSTFPTAADKEFKIVDEAFPTWRDAVNQGELECIRLWTMK